MSPLNYTLSVLLLKIPGVSGITVQRAWALGKWTSLDSNAFIFPLNVLEFGQDN